MNKNIAFFMLMVATCLLYDSLFDLTWLFPQGCNYIFYFVGFHVVIAAISKAFPNFSRLPLSLYIPSNSHVLDNKIKVHSTGAWHMLYLTNRKWFSVACTLIDNDIRHHSGVQTTMNHFRFVFYHNIQRQRKFLFQSVTKITTQRKSKRCL